MSFWDIFKKKGKGKMKPTPELSRKMMAQQQASIRRIAEEKIKAKLDKNIREAIALSETSGNTNSESKRSKPNNNSVDRAY